MADFKWLKGAKVLSVQPFVQQRSPLHHVACLNTSNNPELTYFNSSLLIISSTCFMLSEIYHLVTFIH